MNELPEWLSVQQAADYCGVDHGEMYHKMLRNLEIRRIGVRGVTPYGRLIRVKRESVLRLRGQPEMPSAELPRWVTSTRQRRTTRYRRPLSASGPPHPRKLLYGRCLMLATVAHLTVHCVGSSVG